MRVKFYDHRWIILVWVEFQGQTFVSTEHITQSSARSKFVGEFNETFQLFLLGKSEQFWLINCFLLQCDGVRRCRCHYPSRLFTFFLLTLTKSEWSHKKSSNVSEFSRLHNWNKTGVRACVGEVKWHHHQQQQNRILSGLSRGSGSKKNAAIINLIDLWYLLKAARASF